MPMMEKYQRRRTREHDMEAAGVLEGSRSLYHYLCHIEIFCWSQLDKEFGAITWKFFKSPLKSPTGRQLENRNIPSFAPDFAKKQLLVP